MAKVMKASAFVKKLEDIAKSYKTLYVYGCFGAPMTTVNKKRYINENAYNAKTARAQMINAATVDTFGFDCVNLIKGVLWGWTGDRTKKYGGSVYKSNGVKDLNADEMFKLCSDISSDFSEQIEVGEALWCKGHIGIYIGNGLAVECTPAWKNKVQITAVKNIGSKSGYNARKWTKHGKLPYIEYDVRGGINLTVHQTKPVNVEPAQYYTSSIAGKYKVTATVALHVRSGPDKSKTSIGTISRGTIVQNFGYYGVSPSKTKWLYVKTPDGIEGFCSSALLKKI